MPSSEEGVPFATALVAGGLAGTSVDVALFPIDTIKTRLQSPQGFAKAGGFRGIYQGLGAAAAGSAPGAALFFSVYETSKPKIRQLQQTLGILPNNDSISHMLAASMGEVAACLVRVPTEVVKAKMQTSGGGLVETVREVMTQERHGPLGFVTGGLYRGFGITLFREIPFAMIQFPLYERSKQWIADTYHQSSATPIQGAVCGSVSGGIAAALTTPLDLVKTRLMLGSDKSGKPYANAMDVLRRSVSEEGASVLLQGIQPRVMWISIGGFVFFGAYEGSKSMLLRAF